MFLAGLACCLASSGLACRTASWQGFPEAFDPRFVWPPPPETPRVAFVMEIRSHRDLFKTASGPLGIAGWLSGEPDSALVRPYAVALHPAGGLLISDPGRAVVHFYDWNRRRYIPVGAELEGGLPSPVGVAALPDGRILVSDSRLGRVESFTAQGRPLGPFASEDLFQRPAGIAVNPRRREVYVADVTAHRIGVLDFEGGLKNWIGRRGQAPGEFNFPTHLSLDPRGNLAVTDSMNFRAQLIDPDGQFLRSVGQLGNSPGKFSKPKGLAVDRQGRMIVVEGIYDALQFFSPEGRLLLSLGQPGSEPGQFWLPAGVCMDSERELLFVADSYNARVQVFRFLKEPMP